MPDTLRQIYRGLRLLWHRLAHCGVTPDTPRNDVKHVVVTNVFILVSMGLMVIYPFVNLRVGHPAATWFAIVELVSVPVFGLGLYLNHRHIYWAAPTVFVGAGICTVTVGVVLLGNAIGAELFYIVLAIVPFLMYPRRYLRLAMVMAFLGLCVAMCSASILSREPLFGPYIPRETSGHSFLWSLGGLFILLIIIGYHARQITQIVEDELDRERGLSERLLLNTLPESIAMRLREKTESIADHYDDVSVLFADITSFTPMSQDLSPREVVVFLNGVFSHFDRMVADLGLEKIKTIGDAYMAAGGIPIPRDDHAEAIVELAQRMNAAARRIATPIGAPLELRIGINTGPVVAGVIGEKKFIYDLWGDTVNTASRMESHGESGRIQVAPATYERLKDRFPFEERGIVFIKGKGPMQTWFLCEKPAADAEPLDINTIAAPETLLAAVAPTSFETGSKEVP